MLVATSAEYSFVRFFSSISCQVAMLAEFRFTYIFQYQVIIH